MNPRAVATEGSTCHEDVVRDGRHDPCGEPATGLAFAEGQAYPACDEHRQARTSSHHPEWVDAEYLARHLAVDYDTIMRLTRQGMPSLKLSPGRTGRRRYSVPAIEAWLRERESAAAALPEGDAA